MSILEKDQISSAEALGFLWVRVEDTCLPQEWVDAVLYVNAAEHKMQTEEARRQAEHEFMIEQNPEWQEQLGLAIAFHNQHIWRA